MDKVNKKNVKHAGAVLLLLCLVLFFYHCPVRMITGFPCPGCNFTTAFSYLLKGDLQTSLALHALVIPTFFFWTAAAAAGKKYRNQILLIWGIVFLLYYIYRMIFIFPNYPLMPNENSILFRLLRFVGVF